MEWRYERLPPHPKMARRVGARPYRNAHESYVLRIRGQLLGRPIQPERDGASADNALLRRVADGKGALFEYRTFRVLLRRTQKGSGMTDKQRELAALMSGAVHKLAIEIGRGTASPRAEYDWAIERLDEFKREFAQ